VMFNLLYKCFPDSEELQLVSVRARLGKIDKNYELSTSEDLPFADAVYQTLNRPAALKEDIPTYINLYYQFLRDRKPENDYDPDAPLKRPHPDRLSEDYSRIKPQRKFSRHPPAGQKFPKRKR